MSQPSFDQQPRQPMSLAQVILELGAAVKVRDQKKVDARQAHESTIRFKVKSFWEEKLSSLRLWFYFHWTPHWDEDDNGNEYYVEHPFRDFIVSWLIIFAIFGAVWGCGYYFGLRHR